MITHEKNKDIKKFIIIKGGRRETCIKKIMIAHYQLWWSHMTISLIKQAEHPSPLLPEPQARALSSLILGNVTIMAWVEPAGSFRHLRQNTPALETLESLIKIGIFTINSHHRATDYGNSIVRGLLQGWTN